MPRRLSRHCGYDAHIPSHWSQNVGCGRFCGRNGHGGIVKRLLYGREKRDLGVKAASLQVATKGSNEQACGFEGAAALGGCRLRQAAKPQGGKTAGGSESNEDPPAVRGRPTPKTLRPDKRAAFQCLRGRRSDGQPSRLIRRYGYT